MIHELVALPGCGPEYSDLPQHSRAAAHLRLGKRPGPGGGHAVRAAWVTSAAERLTHRNLFFLPMRGSVDDRSVGAGIVPGHHGVPARRRTGMNPARLLMPTSPARIAPSPGPLQIRTRQIKTHMTTRLTQTRLLMACSPLVV